MYASDKHVLITGGAGFVGTHLAVKLSALGQRVVSLDLKDPATEVPGVEYVRGDVRNQELTTKLISKALAVYHFAATVSVPLCQNDPVASYSNNFSSTLCVLEAIRECAKASGHTPVPLVFASTAAIYGTRGNDGRALAEIDVPNEFLSFYAAQKHASEKAIQLYHACYGVPAFVFRFFNIYGPGQDPSSPYSGVITLFTKFAKEKKPIPLNDGGIQTRDFISVYDIVAGCASVLQIPLPQWDPRPINLGTGQTITVRRLGEMIAETFSDGGSKLVNAPAREGDVLHSLANIERARQVIAFKPERELQTSLRQDFSR